MTTVTTAPTPPRESRSPLAPVLVGPAWLRSHLDEVRVIDTRQVARFTERHVLGARSFPLEALLVDDTSPDALHRLAAAARIALAIRGITPDDHVVLVDDHDGSAALGALVCELAGMRRVSVLLGGICAWHAASGEVSIDPPDTAARVDAAWIDARTNLDRLATFEQLASAASRGTARILDVRSQLEHEGLVGPPCCADRGSIPSAIHLEWTNLLDLAGEPRLADDVRRIMARCGIERDDAVIVTCHAGHRAAAAARVLRASGFPDVRVSLGSWHEWSARVPSERTGAEHPGAVLAGNVGH